MLHSNVVKVIAVVYFLFFLTGCGSSSSGGDNSSQVEQDTSPPVVNITSSDSTSLMPYLLTGTVTDNTAVTALSYTINSGPAESIQAVQSPFSVSLNLAEGDHLISVMAEDTAGNTTTADITINYSITIPAPVGTSTTELLDTAVSNGDIDQETALLYQVYTLFGDSRVPQQYRGENAQGLLDHALDEIMLQYDSLSVETKAILDPYLVPPYYQGSWWNLRTSAAVRTAGDNSVRADTEPPCNPREDCNVNTDQWVYLDTANGKARVWYVSTNAGDAVTAAFIASEIDTTIWQKLTTLLDGQQPILDTHDFNNGGDGRLDISLIDFSDPNLSGGFEFAAGTFGFVRNYPPGCEKDSVYMVVNTNKTNDEILATVVHELKHAFQWSYDVAETCLNGRDNYKWLMEASATWAIDYVYENSQIEHDYANLHFFPNPELSLNDLVGNHEYGAYVFPFYLARSFSPAWVGAIWHATIEEDELDVLQAGIHDASGGQTSLEEQWAKFTIRNWNRDDIDDYRNWDSLANGTTVIKTMIDPTEVKLNGAEAAKIEIPVRLPHLSSQYANFIFTDSNVRSVAFSNGFTQKLSSEQVTFPPSSTAYVAEPLTEEEKKGGQIWALMKIGGSWLEPEDWTDKPFKTFCRDEVAERIEELVIIFSNADITDRQRFMEPQGENSLLAFSNTACWQWQGGAHFVDNNDGVIAQLDVTATWERVSPMISPTPIESDRKALVGTTYRLSEGSLTWDISGTDSSGCHYSGSKELSLVEMFTPGSNVYQNYNYVTAGEAYRGITLTGFIKNFMPIMATVTEDCPNSSPDVRDEPIYPLLSVLPKDANGKVDASGSIIGGDGEDSTGGSSVTGSWNFTAIREP